MNLQRTRKAKGKSKKAKVEQHRAELVECAEGITLRMRCQRVLKVKGKSKKAKVEQHWAELLPKSIYSRFCSFIDHTFAVSLITFAFCLERFSMNNTRRNFALVLVSSLLPFAFCLLP